MSSSAKDAFNRAAGSYDTTFEALPGTARIRRIVQTILLREYRPGTMVLELNAGTGTDALFLARHGVRVHATDLSPAMVEVIRHKAAENGLGDSLTAEVVDIGAIVSLRGRKFDGVFSDMGGLNCLRDLSGLPGVFREMLGPGAPMILCFMPPVSLWETLSFGMRGDWRNVRRRRAPEGCLVEVSGVPVRTFYHAPREVLRTFSGAFHHVGTVGLNIITPPPSSRAAHRRLRPILPLLERAEDLLAPFPPFNGIGDHAVMVFRRSP